MNSKQDLIEYILEYNEYMANKYNTSSGELISQATIDRRRSELYRELYDSQNQPCWGCNGMAQGSAHIIPQKRAKDIGMAELCYSAVNVIPCCHSCNSIIESYKGEEFKRLKCYDLILEVTEKYDKERYLKMTL